MKRFLMLMLIALPSLCFAKVEISSMRVNGLDSPMGISPVDKPVLSWILTSDESNTVQTAYQISVTSEGKKVWDSGKVQSDNSTKVDYQGPLASDTYYTWTLRVWDNHGNVTKRAVSKWHTGIKADEWEAQWIAAVNQPLPSYFRKECNVSGKIRKAVAYVTSHGFYEAYINGQRVGDYYLTPGWTSYNKRIQYQAYDVTSLMKGGSNLVAAVVSPGWYSGGMNWGDKKKRYKYGNDVALLMQINVEYTNGKTETIITDGSWNCSVPAQEGAPKAGGITFANVYDGQTIDARLIDQNWNNMGYAEEWPSQVLVMNTISTNIVPTVNEPVVRHQPLKAVKYIVTPKGEKVIDFGQNIVGWERIRLNGKKGDNVVVTHAEVLDKDGNFYTTNMRKAETTSRYVLNGGGQETFEPVHTFYGFRYIKVEGVEGDLNLEDFEAVPVFSGFDQIGAFNSSNELVNQLHSNSEWSFHDNFVDVPTDCPQRDERLGWTGDAQVFFRTATFMGRVDNFFRKWLVDLSLDQRPDGRIPKIIPDTFPKDNARTSSTGWADAATIVPWNHYMAYGDIAILEQQYASMKAWVDYMINNSKDNGYLWTNGDHYGDWLFHTIDNDRDGQSAVTSKNLAAQCFYANSVDIMKRSAELLGKAEDAAYYSEVASKVRQAYMNEYVTPNGLISSDTQTAYVLALQFNMLPENMREGATERLVDNIRRYKNHITTGFLGTSYICNVLTDNGRSDVAYDLLLQETCPSWLYPVTKGATTIWERWNSIRPDGSIIGGMNSFNHYSYGSICDWLYRSAVGIRETSPGFKTISVRPNVGGDFENMEASTQTPYGKVAASWTAKDNVLKTLKVEIPVNTTAEIFVPASSAEVVKTSLKADSCEDGYVKYTVGSGSYLFTVE